MWKKEEIGEHARSMSDTRNSSIGTKETIILSDDEDKDKKEPVPDSTEHAAREPRQPNAQVPNSTNSSRYDHTISATNDDEPEARDVVPPTSTLEPETIILSGDEDEDKEEPVPDSTKHAAREPRQSNA
jgi:hypothetical protein